MVSAMALAGAGRRAGTAIPGSIRPRAAPEGGAPDEEGGLRALGASAAAGSDELTIDKIVPDGGIVRR